MSALTNPKINTLARLLKNEKSVDFKHNGFHYEVFESTESGYVVNLYSSDKKDVDGEYLDKYLVDGGLCTGSAKDAVEFMM